MEEMARRKQEKEKERERQRVHRRETDRLAREYERERRERRDAQPAKENPAMLFERTILMPVEGAGEDAAVCIARRS